MELGKPLILLAFKIVGQFPDWTVPQLILPLGHIPDGHFLEVSTIADVKI